MIRWNTIKSYGIAAIFCLVSNLVPAQKHFVIYSVTGNVSIKTNNEESRAIAGKLLTANHVININTDGGIALICKEGTIFSITETGSFSLDQFGNSCPTGTGHTITNYAQYLWKHGTKPYDNPGRFRKAYMNGIGARTGLGEIWVNSMFDTLNYSGIGDLPLSWKSYSEKQFDFHLYYSDNIETPLFSDVLSKDIILISDFLSSMKQGGTFYWTVSTRGGENTRLNVLNYVSKETYEGVLSGIGNRKPAIEAPAEQAYRTAFMLEDAHYLAEAYQYYTKAVSLDSTNALYRSTLMSFKKDYEIK